MGPRRGGCGAGRSAARRGRDDAPRRVERRSCGARGRGAGAGQMCGARAVGRAQAARRASGGRVRSWAQINSARNRRVPSGEPRPGGRRAQNRPPPARRRRPPPSCQDASHTHTGLAMRARAFFPSLIEPSMSRTHSWCDSTELQLRATSSLICGELQGADGRHVRGVGEEERPLALDVLAEGGHRAVRRLGGELGREVAQAEARGHGGWSRGWAVERRLRVRGRRRGRRRRGRRRALASRYCAAAKHGG